MLKRSLATLAVLVAASALAGCSSDSDGETATDPAPTSAAASSPTSSESDPFTGSPTPATSPAAGAVDCIYTPDGAASKEAELPPAQAAQTGQVPGTIATSVGDLTITLDADNAPCTVNSFVSLAQQGYFDDTTCHRLTTQGIFVLQCGDPSASGSGGPGYSFGDELKGTETYGAGTLAMANAGPDTNGSQFFIVFGDSELSPDYTVFGSVDAAGIKIVEGVAKDGSTPSGDGTPNTPVDIESVTVQ